MGCCARGPPGSRDREQQQGPSRGAGPGRCDQRGEYGASGEVESVTWAPAELHQAPQECRAFGLRPACDGSGFDPTSGKMAAQAGRAVTATGPCPLTRQHEGTRVCPHPVSRDRSQSCCYPCLDPTPGPPTPSPPDRRRLGACAEGLLWPQGAQACPGRHSAHSTKALGRRQAAHETQTVTFIHCA